MIKLVSEDRQRKSAVLQIVRKSVPSGRPRPALVLVLYFCSCFHHCKYWESQSDVVILWQASQLQTSNVYVRGCRWKFLAWLENNLDVVGATALAFAILHVRMLCLFVCLLLRMKQPINNKILTSKLCASPLASPRGWKLI